MARVKTRKTSVRSKKLLDLSVHVAATNLPPHSNNNGPEQNKQWGWGPDLEKNQKETHLPPTQQSGGVRVAQRSAVRPTKTDRSTGRTKNEPTAAKFAKTNEHGHQLP